MDTIEDTKNKTGHGEAPERRQRYAIVVALVFGFPAIAALLGLLKWLPPAVSFFVAALAILLFPGLALGATVFRRSFEGLNFVEKLAVWCLAGLAVLTVFGFIGIVLKVRLGALVLALAVFYLGICIFLLVKARRAVPRFVAGSPKRGRLGILLLLVAAVVLATITLVGPRDTDDWFYLAYISDYVRGQPINSTDPLLGPEWSSPARAWYGGWWVGEAIICKAAAIGAIPCHQVYMPLLLFPFAVFACFMLARQIFKSDGVAYLACFLQILFYLSSAYPSDSAGWALFARTAQDKSLTFLVPLFVFVALALKLLDSTEGIRKSDLRSTYALCILALVSAGLIHPMGLVWCAVAIIPFGLVEVCRRRDRRAAFALVLVLIPFALSALLLAPGREATSLLEQPALTAREGGGTRDLLNPFLPGDRVRFGSGDRIYDLGADLWIAHPLLIFRYPMAVLGLILVFPVCRWLGTSRAARFLIVVTGAVLILGFTPGVTRLTAALITEKMLYRLSWLFPWGFIIAFFLSRIGLRLRWAWIIALVLMLGLCKGNPANYLSLLKGSKQTGRASPELVDAFQALSEQPAPRGVILASANIGVMIPAFVSEAYPAFVSPAYSTGFRSEAVKTNKDMRNLLQRGVLDAEVMETIHELGSRYILIEASRPLANALRHGEDGFEMVYRNRTYSIWKISTAGTKADPSDSASEYP